MNSGYYSNILGRHVFVWCFSKLFMVLSVHTNNTESVDCVSFLIDGYFPNRQRTPDRQKTGSLVFCNVLSYAASTLRYKSLTATEHMYCPCRLLFIDMFLSCTVQPKIMGQYYMSHVYRNR